MEMKKRNVVYSSHWRAFDVDTYQVAASLKAKTLLAMDLAQNMAVPDVELLKTDMRKLRECASLLQGAEVERLRMELMVPHADPETTRHIETTRGSISTSIRIYTEAIKHVTAYFAVANPQTEQAIPTAFAGLQEPRVIGLMETAMNALNAKEDSPTLWEHVTFFKAIPDMTSEMWRAAYDLERIIKKGIEVALVEDILERYLRKLLDEHNVGYCAFKALAALDAATSQDASEDRKINKKTARYGKDEAQAVLQYLTEENQVTKARKRRLNDLASIENTTNMFVVPLFYCADRLDDAGKHMTWANRGLVTPSNIHPDGSDSIEQIMWTVYKATFRLIDVYTETIDCVTSMVNICRESMAPLTMQNFFIAFGQLRERHARDMTSALLNRLYNFKDRLPTQIERLGLHTRIADIITEAEKVCAALKAIVTMGVDKAVEDAIENAALWDFNATRQSYMGPPASEILSFAVL